jgi:outer membrane protein insertion porin family
MLPRNFILSLHAEGGYVHALKSNPEPGVDAIRLTDRFFGPQMRGFDIRGIGPRVIRRPYNPDGTLNEDASPTSDAIGGRAYYMGRVEVEIPVSSNIKSLGLRPSAFIDVGSVFMLEKPDLVDIQAVCSPISANDDVIYIPPAASCPATGYIQSTGYKEFYEGDSPKPRLSIGVGVNWNSPFGPLRLDIAKALLKQEGDQTKFFSFNVGTQF